MFYRVTYSAWSACRATINGTWVVILCFVVSELLILFSGAHDRGPSCKFARLLLRHRRTCIHISLHSGVNGVTVCSSCLLYTAVLTPWHERMRTLHSRLTRHRSRGFAVHRRRCSMELAALPTTVLLELILIVFCVGVILKPNFLAQLMTTRVYPPVGSGFRFFLAHWVGSD